MTTKNQIKSDIDSIVKAHKLKDDEILESVLHSLKEEYTEEMFLTMHDEALLALFPEDRIFNYSGGYIHGDELVDFEIPVMIHVEDGVLWAQDRDGDEFEVSPEEISLA